MIVARRTALLALGLAFAPIGLAHADPLDDRLAAIAAARARTKTLSASFTQERKIGLLAAKVTSTGRLTMALPDRVRWDVTSDGVSYWIGPEGLAYRGRQGKGRLPASDKLSKDLGELRAWLSGDPRSLRDRYDLVERAGDAGTLTLVATPKPGRGARYARVELTLDADLVRPRKVVLVEGERDRTDVTFGEVVKDAAVDPASLRLPD